MIATESAQGFEILRFLSSPANSIAILDSSSAKSSCWQALNQANGLAESSAFLTGYRPLTTVRPTTQDFEVDPQRVPPPAIAS